MAKTKSLPPRRKDRRTPPHAGRRTAPRAVSPYRAASSHNHQVMWLVVADGSSARILEAEEGHQDLILVRELSHPASRAKGSELITDRQGKFMDRGELPKDLEAVRFTIQLARELEVAYAQSRFANLVLLGPPDVLGELRKRLKPSVLRHVVASMHKDYTHLRLDAMEPRLVNTLREAFVNAHAQQ